MKKEIEAYISGCKTCGRTNPQEVLPEGSMKRFSTAEGPWKLVSVNYIVKFPILDDFNAILVIVDQFT